jgi:hypothetical protein
MWAWVGSLLKELAQQKLKQSGTAGRIGAGIWEGLGEQEQLGTGQYPIEQYPDVIAAGGYLPQGQTLITDVTAGGGYFPQSQPTDVVAAGGYLPQKQRQMPITDEESFWDVFFKALMSNRR